MSIQPPSVLLIGTIGSGKTHCISTLLDAGLKVFVVVTEPTGLDTLVDVAIKKGKLDNLHWRQIAPARQGLGDMIKMAEKISGNSYESLSKLPPQGDRKKARFIELLNTLNDFKDERTGQSFGPVEKFGPDSALVVDSLSGINLMAMDLVVGDKPTAHQGEWGVAMSSIERLVNSLSSGLTCTFVLTAHLEREADELTGGSKLMASALGRKLAPKLPRFFSEVVHVYRDGASFYWSTNTVNVETKMRVLPLGNKLEPSFKPIIEAYHKRLKSTGDSAKPKEGAM